jgi:hypothetical protein
MKYLLFVVPIVLIAFEPSFDNIYDNSHDPLVIMSSNKKYRGSITYGIGNTEYVPIDEFVLKDNEGHILYTTRDLDHTLVDIANNGVFVGIDFNGPISGQGMLHFYDQQGVVLATSQIGFLLDRRFSRNGERYCVNDGASGVRVFRTSGEELYNLGKGNYFSISPDGGLVAVARDVSIDVHENGSLVQNIPLSSPFVRQMVFSQDGKAIVFIDKKNLYCYDLDQGEMVFHYTEENDHLHIISCDISPDRSMVIVGLDEDPGRNSASRHQQGTIMIVDMEGIVLWSYEIPYTSWNIQTPHVAFTGTSSFSVETVESTREFSF